MKHLDMLVGINKYDEKNIFNLLLIILGITIAGTIIIGFYYLFSTIDEKEKISKLENYEMLLTERILKKFECERKNM